MSKPSQPSPSLVSQLNNRKKHNDPFVEEVYVLPEGNKVLSYELGFKVPCVVNKDTFTNVFQAGKTKLQSVITVMLKRDFKSFMDNVINYQNTIAKHPEQGSLIKLALETVYIRTKDYDSDTIITINISEGEMLSIYTVPEFGIKARIQELRRNFTGLDVFVTRYKPQPQQ